MRYRTHAILALLLLWTCTCVFGQDLRLFGALGKLEPVASWDGKSDKPVVLVYKTRGVMFQVYGRGIMLAAVFPRASSQSAGSHSLGANDLIPGVGARGVMLGASRDQVKQSPFAIGARLMADQADGLMYRGDRGNVLAIGLSGGKASQIEVMGEFRTPEGATEKSTIPDIEKAYGRADQYHQVVDMKNPFMMLLVLLIMLILGLVLGLLTGRVIRDKMRDDAGSGALVRGMMIAAVALATFSFLFALVFLWSMGMSIEWKLTAVNTASAGVTGAICTLVMRVLGSRMSGCLGSLVALLSMLIVSSVTVALTMGAGPVDFSAQGLLGSGILPAPFILGLTLTGRTKTAKGERREA